MEYKEIQELRSHRDNLLISVAHIKIMLAEGCMNFIDREMRLHGECHFYDGTMWTIKVHKKNQFIYNEALIVEIRYKPNGIIILVSDNAMEFNVTSRDLDDMEMACIVNVIYKEFKNK